MSKWCWIAVALAAVFQADAHTLVDESTSCGSGGGSSTLEVRILSTQNGKAGEKCEETNKTTLEDLVREIKNEIDLLKDEVADVKNMIAPCAYIARLLLGHLQIRQIWGKIPRSGDTV